MSLNMICSAGPVAGGSAQSPTLVDSFIATDEENNWSVSPGFTLSSGDIIVIIFSSGDGNGSFSWGDDASPTDLIDYSGSDPAFYIGYQVSDGTETTFSVSGAGGFSSSVICLLQFSEAGTPIDKGDATGASGDPNPPEATGLTAGSILIAAGCIDTAVELSQPAGWTLTERDEILNIGESSASSLCVAQLIADSSTEDPGEFAASGSTNWKAGIIEIPYSA
jgi:hypothetical protein